jgi:hypothetical protein
MHTHFFRVGKARDTQCAETHDSFVRPGHVLRRRKLLDLESAKVAVLQNKGLCFCEKSICLCRVQGINSSPLHKGGEGEESFLF